MTKSYIAYLGRSRMPDRQALQAALKAMRFPLTIDDGQVPFESGGYLPRTLDGEDAGVDLRFSDSATQLAGQPQLQEAVGARDAAIVLRWGGDPRERASALMLAAVLAHRFNARVQAQLDGRHAAHAGRLAGRSAPAPCRIVGSVNRRDA